jgi:alpha-1,2-mannosyltransferase
MDAPAAGRFGKTPNQRALPAAVSWLLDSRRAQFACLAAVAIAVPLGWWIVSTIVRGASSFNDYHDFYYAARLITEGRSPYDIHALGALARSEGQAFVVGTGYSYFLPFAVALIPLSYLPFTASLLVFNALGLLLFGLTVAAWIGWAHGWSTELFGRRLVLAAAAGLYPSVYGTLGNGQANLVLLPLLALGTIAILDSSTGRRAFAGGIGVGLAAVVKLTPGLFVVPLLIVRRMSASVGIVAGILGSLALATLAAPWARAGSSGLLSLLDPDSYFSNQSINGFVSRLVLPSGRTLPLWPHAFDARLAATLLTAAFALATLAVLLAARRALLGRRGLALGLGLALVAGLIGAPKGTYWNQAFLLVSAGLLLAVEAPDLRIRRLGAVNLCLLGFWLAATALQTHLWTNPLPKEGSFPALVTLLTSSSVYGALALWLVLARRLRRAAGTATSDPPDQATTVASAEAAAG